MVIDTSAIVAILADEPERRSFNLIIEADRVRLLSAVSLVETAIVLGNRYGEAAERELDLFVYKANIEITPVDTEQAGVARRAYIRFGKGRHPARLNFGDCFAYALAKVTGEPLLYKGSDFSQTDILSC